MFFLILKRHKLSGGGAESDESFEGEKMAERTRDSDGEPGLCRFKSTMNRRYAMKRLLTLFIIVSLMAVASSSSAFAEPSVTVIINGQQVNPDESGKYVSKAREGNIDVVVTPSMGVTAVARHVAILGRGVGKSRTEDAKYTSRTEGEKEIISLTYWTTDIMNCEYMLSAKNNRLSIKMQLGE